MLVDINVQTQVWLGGVTGGLVTARLLVRLSSGALPGEVYGQIVHTRASVTKQYNLVLVIGW